MRHLKLIIAVLLLGIFNWSCGSKDDYPTYPRPNWELSALPGTYSASMIIVMSLPDHLAKNEGDTDLIGAFIGEECRGVATVKKYDGKNLYFLLIKGDAAEQNNVFIRYYCGKNSYMYASQNSIPFVIDNVHGDADTPFIPDFVPME
ncbi:hypothetical protein LJB97_02980 [Parabacteroides sp. OttesenSCG-928-O15]|nr:hypothetical protein [Parabacteroides sp. OttesenSCG-928-O15]